MCTAAGRYPGNEPLLEVITAGAAAAGAVVLAADLMEAAMLWAGQVWDTTYSSSTIVRKAQTDRAASGSSHMRQTIVVIAGAMMPKAGHSISSLACSDISAQ